MGRERAPLNFMKPKMLLTAMLLCGTVSYAQTGDPVVMTINHQPVSRSEFEYAFNKNNAEGVIDKKSLDEYVDLFINYKLKVMAAEDARLDTLTSFKNEFAGYRDQQVRPAFITDADVEAEARKIYQETASRVNGGGGLVKPAHILVHLSQRATADEQRAAKVRIDSIYNALRHGADFATLARQCSDDKGSAVKGGELTYFEHGQLLKEFEDRVFAAKKGETTEPFLSPAGWHIARVMDKCSFFPYDSVRADIVNFIDQRGLRERIIDNKLDSLSKAQGPQVKPADVLAAKLEELESKDGQLKYLVKEYHDGLLLFEISNRSVWEKAQKDVAGQRQFFAKNKKRYKWDEPRFKGMAYHVKDKQDLKAVKDCVKSLPFDQWAERLRATFNSDSIHRIRVEKGIFKRGDNALVDREVFKKDTTMTAVKGYPYNAVFGKKLKAPQEMEDVKAQVVADYQEALEKEWVEALRKKYPVSVDKEVLKTVNNHK